MTTLKEKKRIADAMSDAGVGARRTAIELLYLLPDDFVRQYEELFHRALSLGDEGRGAKDERNADLGKHKGSGRAGRGGSSGQGSGSRSVFPVRSEEAFEEKAWVDRQLRKLARQIKNGRGAGLERKRCGSENRVGGSKKKERGCGKWLEEGWKFCARCGLEVPDEVRAR